MNESDSDFTEFSSVASDRVKHYEGTYKAMMRDPDGRVRPNARFNLHQRNATVTSNSFKNTMKSKISGSPAKIDVPGHRHGRARFLN